MKESQTGMKVKAGLVTLPEDELDHASDSFSAVMTAAPLSYSKSDPENSSQGLV